MIILLHGAPINQIAYFVICRLLYIRLRQVSRLSGTHILIMLQYIDKIYCRLDGACSWADGNDAERTNKLFVEFQFIAYL